MENFIFSAVTALGACCEKQVGMLKKLLSRNTKYFTNLMKSFESVLLKRCL